MENRPLVSVVVLTFNSSKYVVETLESIKQQSCKNLELVVTDDCSTDNTVEIVEQWIKNENSSGSFIKTKLIKSFTNTGLPGNCNRGISGSTGVWIKFLAGDDALDKDAINSSLKYIESNPNVDIFASTANFYDNVFTNEKLIKTMNLSESSFFKATSYEQYNLLLRGNRINAGTVFIKRSLIEDVGQFIEKFKYIEDYPMWLKITKNGTKIHYMDELTLKYRVHNYSIYANGLDTKIFNNFYLHLRQVQEEMVLPELSRSERLKENFNFYKMVFFDKANLNRNTPFLKFLFHLPTSMSALGRFLGEKIKRV